MHFTSGDLTKSFSDIFHIDEGRMLETVRSVRIAGFIRRNGRGRSAANMTETDVAAVLIALLSAVSHKHTGESMQYFGSFNSCEGFLLPVLAKHLGALRKRTAKEARVRVSISVEPYAEMVYEDRTVRFFPLRPYKGENLKFTEIEVTRRLLPGQLQRLAAAILPIIPPKPPKRDIWKLSKQSRVNSQGWPPPIQPINSQTTP